ncbi:unnamed protein product [Heterobilharzia americana]|nr:unnamed protein product [Heterobilharzia americana]
MQTDDLISTSGDKLSNRLNAAPTPNILDGSDSILSSPYCKTPGVKHITEIPHENLGLRNSNANVISLAEALPKKIREQMDRRDAVRKKTLSRDFCTDQKQTDLHENKFVCSDIAKNPSQSTNNQEKGDINLELSGTFAQSSVSLINSPLPICCQITGVNVSPETDPLTHTIASKTLSSDLEPFRTPSINRQTSLSNRENTSISNKPSFSRCPSDQHFSKSQFKPVNISSLFENSDLDLLKKPKSDLSAVKTSITRRKQTKSNLSSRARTKISNSLLSSAAEGLQELSQDSSDDDDNLLDHHSLAYFDKQNSILKLSESSGNSSSTDSSRHTYTMESTSELLDRNLDLRHSEKTYDSGVFNNAPSNTGGHVHDLDGHPVGNGTFTRPRLPHTVMPNTEIGLRFNITNGSARDNKSHRPLKVTELLSFEKLDDYLFDTQKLVSQLEQKMANNKSEKGTCQAQWSTVTSNMNGSPEDYEVAKALNNADQLIGSAVNKRLSAILQRRQDRSKPDSCDVEKLKRGVNGSNDTSEQRSTRSRRIGQPVMASRPQSQQPIPRCGKNSSSHPCEHSSVPLRNASETRRNYPNRLSHISFSNGRPTASSNHLTISSTPESSRQSGSDSVRNNKVLAALSWQRRKAYDPRQFINKSSEHSAARSQSRPPKDDNIMSISTDSNSKSCVTSRSIHPTHKLTVITRRTAPVDTADCIAAMEVVKQIKMMNGPQDMLSVYSKKTNKSIVGSCRRGLVNQQNQDVRETESKHMTASVRKSSTCESRVKTRQTNKNNSIPDDPMHHKDHSVFLNINENKTGQRSFPSVVTARLPTDRHFRNGNITVQNATQSCADESSSPCSLNTLKFNSTGITNKIFTQETNKGEMNYPDIAVESLKYKIEKLTNFIVRLRKRIERDYAEHGTCSPGDDVFGDEAVGAVVAGRPTGMHPVVATCLQNLRILEVNAQEIFSLLYPNEVDFWEPARVCLAEGKGDERLFNDARSQITEHLSTSIECSTKVNQNTCNNHRKLPSPLDSPPGLSNNTKESDMFGVADLI